MTLSVPIFFRVSFAVSTFIVFYGGCYLLLYGAWVFKVRVCDFLPDWRGVSLGGGLFFTRDPCGCAVFTQVCIFYVVGSYVFTRGLLR